MIVNNSAALQEIEPENRILLLPHCLRLSLHCKARYDRDKGLLCMSCTEDCPVNQLKTAAEKRGFGDVCIAPGGTLAIRYVKTHLPQGIVAVACDKELEMGMEVVSSLGDNGNTPQAIVVVTIPLCQDGCVDTKVDLATVKKIIDL